MNPWPAVLAGVASGMVARLGLLRVDYRSYPGYPHGYISHVAQGLVASLLGAVALPALVERQYTAVTFLSLVAQQFRDVRRMEREALGNLETTEMVPRGTDYIEGIARVFESRNYLVMMVGLGGAAAGLLATVVLLAPVLALGAGLVVGLLLAWWVTAVKPGRQVGDIARVRPASVRFDGANLFVEDIQIMNVGDADSRQEILAYGRGAIVEPLDRDARQTLADVGQRQAMVHDAAKVLGVRRDVDTQEFTPLARRHLPTGRVALYIVPDTGDSETLVAVIRRTPVLESARGTASYFDTRSREG